MNELQAILSAAAQIQSLNESAVLATVVKVGGSTYRRPGARMLITPTGRRIGSVSGGCLEGDVARRAWQLTADGNPALLRYDSTSPDDALWGFGLGCNGTIEVLVERLAHANDHLHFLRAQTAARRACVVVTVFRVESPGAVALGDRLLLDGDGRIVAGLPSLAAVLLPDTAWALALGRSATKIATLQDGQTIEVLVESVEPPLPLLIFGAGWDALPLVASAKALGWHVTVTDRRAGYAAPNRFPLADNVVACAPDDISQHLPLDSRTFAVVMTHNYPDDLAILQHLLPSSVQYVGLLGPAHRKERLLADLADVGCPLTSDQLRKLHGPVGLDIGADSPAEIAAAVVAEILTVRNGRRGGPLRDHPGPIHQPLDTDAPLTANATETLA